MIRPATFGSNPETARNNYFQLKNNEQDLSRKALLQFDEMVKALEEKNINVWVVPDTEQPSKPDAVFPNNWFTCNNNCITLYPMQATNRRIEKRSDIIELVKSRTGISIVKDLSFNEARHQFLEGSGSMCYDHNNRIIYACRSERTHENVLNDYAKSAGYTVVLFDAVDLNGNPVYHTNVLMCIGESLVIICEDAIVTNKEEVMSSLQKNHKLISISKEQMHRFAGNMLEVKNKQGIKYLLMSSTAFHSLTSDQLTTLHEYSEPLVVNVDVIENGGGSVRCMVAEIFY